MKLVSPSGVRISVSDDRGEKLKAQGYKGTEESVPALPETPKPRRRRKAPSEEA